MNPMLPCTLEMHDMFHRYQLYMQFKLLGAFINKIKTKDCVTEQHNSYKFHSKCVMEQ